jgi:DNA-binding winged helix-turn-helix (wHTH) protein
MARIEAILRRVEGMKNRQAPAVVKVGDIEVDAPRHRVTMAGNDVNLTPMEFELLYFLAANCGEVFDRETLFQEVWGYDYVGETNLVDVCVRRLREKIETEPSKPRRILTVRGVGYKMADISEEVSSVIIASEPVTEPLVATSNTDAEGVASMPEQSDSDSMVRVVADVIAKREPPYSLSCTGATRGVCSLLIVSGWSVVVVVATFKHVDADHVTHIEDALLLLVLVFGVIGGHCHHGVVFVE